SKSIKLRLLIGQFTLRVERAFPMRLFLTLLFFTTTAIVSTTATASAAEAASTATGSQYNCQEPEADTIKEFELLVGDQFLLVKKLENKQEVKFSGKLLEARNGQKLYGGYEGFFAENESVILLSPDVIA